MILPTYHTPIVKTALIVLFTATIVVFISRFVYPIIIGSASASTIEGLATQASGNSAGGGGKNAGSVPKEDEDLKCPGPSRKDTKCGVPDIIQLGYELSSDPMMSQVEQEKIHAVFASRSKDTKDKNEGEKLETLLNRFLGDVMMLRFSVMFNTTPNEPQLKATLDEIVKKNDVKTCYSQEDMKLVKGLLVGTAEQKTLTVAQSEAMRCYMQRFNSVRSCLGVCTDKKI